MCVFFLTFILPFNRLLQKYHEKVIHFTLQYKGNVAWLLKVKEVF
jgi:hypothetical protein